MPESALRFRPVGACIYCGADGGAVRLSDEHIIPYALNGKAILPLSSCACCAKITSALELRLARGIFQPMRLLSGFRTRRPKKRPKTLPVFEVDDVDGLASKPMHIPLDVHPAFHILPSFEQPGILVGKEPSDQFHNMKLYTWFPSDLNDRMARMKAMGMKKSMLESFSLADFVRLLAKIAHGAAVADFGHGHFRPLLLDLILDKSSLPGYSAHYVGGAPGKLPDTERSTHRVSTAVHHVNEKALLVVTIRLFGFLVPPAPVYVVVAGEFSLQTFCAA